MVLDIKKYKLIKMKNYILLKKIEEKEKKYNDSIIEYKYLYKKLTKYYQKENEFDTIGIENYDREKNEILIELMKIVRDKHTYINRINALFWFINQYKNNYLL